MDHGGQLFGHVAAAGLLHKAQHPRDRHHHRDDPHCHIVPLGRRHKHNIGEGGHHRQQQQHQRERVREGFQQPAGRALALGFGQPVGAVLFPGCLGLLCGQARRGRPQLCQQFGLGAGGRLPQPPVRAPGARALGCRVCFDPFHHHGSSLLFVPHMGPGGRKKAPASAGFGQIAGASGCTELRPQAGAPAPCPCCCMLPAVCLHSSTAGVHCAHFLSRALRAHRGRPAAGCQNHKKIPPVR